MQAISQLIYYPMTMIEPDVIYCTYCRLWRVKRPGSPWCAQHTLQLTSDWPDVDDDVDPAGLEPAASDLRSRRSPR